jgi:hypothetical protein
MPLEHLYGLMFRVPGYRPTDPGSIPGVMCDKSWVYGYDPVTNFFLYIDGNVHKEFFPPGQTVNEDFFRDVLRRLSEGIRRKRP